MTDSLPVGGELQGSPSYKEKLLKQTKEVFGHGIDFLKKGAKRRQTYLRLKELTAERLKAVPNYVVLEAAKKHIRLGIEAVLAASIVANFIFVSRLLDASEKLTQKRIALVPSKLDQITEVDVGQISERQVHGTFVMYLNLLGAVDGTNIAENYRILKDFMSPELRIQFERETKEYRRMVAEEGLAEQLKITTKKIEISKDGNIKAEAVVRIQPSFGATVGKTREERIVMQMRVVTNYERNQWLLQLTELTRGPLQGN
ncbi:MAG: hypothetical protein HUU57_13145 [Bdellovibrio sp.]|nr:hypothetical protein [Bdellovibrio sp.]